MLLAPAPAIAQTPIFIDSGQNLGADFSTAVALGDVDSDGDLDAVVGNHQGQVNQLWLNDGRGAFVVSAQALGSGSTTDVALGALDGDDRLDLFVVNGLAGGGAPGRVWLNRGGGEMMRTTAMYGEGLPANDVALADFDGDGFLDAFVANGAFYNYQPNLIWFGDGRGGFVDSGLRLANPERATSEAVAVGDLDGDGHLDAFAAGRVTGERRRHRPRVEAKNIRRQRGDDGACWRKLRLHRRREHDLARCSEGVDLHGNLERRAKELARHQ